MADTLQKHTVRLLPGQLEKLRAFHPTLAQDEILRQLISAYIRKCETKEKTNVNNG